MLFFRILQHIELDNTFFDKRNTSSVISIIMYKYQKKPQTALQIAASDNNLEMTKILIDDGADVNGKDDIGYTALHFAVRNSNHVIVEYLISHGADVNAKTIYGITPLHSVVYNFYYGSNRRIKSLKTLLKNGANINAVDHSNLTPLMGRLFAYYHSGEWRGYYDSKETEVLRFLLEYSDVNSIDMFYVFQLRFINLSFAKTVLEHLAKLQAINFTFKVGILDKISEHEDHNAYFKECMEELKLAKKIKLKDSWVSYFDLLVHGKRQLKNYAGNKGLIEDFKTGNDLKRFSIYGNCMQNNVDKGLKRRELFDKSAVLLSACLPIFSPTHLVITDILDCVSSMEDLSKFCE